MKSKKVFVEFVESICRTVYEDWCEDGEIHNYKQVIYHC